MKKKIVQSLFLLIIASTISTYTYISNNKPIEAIDDSNKIPPENLIKIIDTNEITVEPLNVSSVGTSEEDENLEINSVPLVFPESYFNPETEEYEEEEFWDDMELIALVCVAEAEDESELGKRLVIDNILNRLESPYFPNTIHEVVYANNPPQYSCVWDGRLERVEYNEYIANLVLEEFHNRTNNEVFYFKTNGFFNHGNPIMQEGNHFFSGR